MGRCVAMLRANDLDVYVDLVEHHRGGGSGHEGKTFRYVDGLVYVANSIGEPSRRQSAAELQVDRHLPGASGNGRDLNGFTTAGAAYRWKVFGVVEG